ncbi:Ankyrin repeat domain-containing protein 50 [Emericellopsis cladophorae]|uniref:Ankyrin repeat domain-containing protein 50 n=1 Tax=Emericellopsis cladophorae TaxID=2686198 RepID=A0A9Q0BCS6_9HYPO|nr:Ankyrin repeat domain-containing protein 50 [Emericellopsis cladophorae]KAI6780066.1 Ankyrin repeat domain-containing protein 50 [Emericellopsis cladophorae]
MSDSQCNANDYTVGWVCALPLEMAAAQGMLDEIHPNLSEQASGDHNNYVLGQVGEHNVVIACLPVGIYGTTPAATVAKDMLRTFKSIRFGLMVGIGGGAPSSGHDIRLGDIVVSQPYGKTGGVIQYDRGKDGLDGFERTGSLNTPPQLLLAALGRLQADHLMRGSRIPGFLSELLNKYPIMKKAFSFQGESNDCLFQAEYEHAGGDSGCEQCDRTRAVQRDVRDDADPVVHYGNIASGNQVIKNARTRDRLSKELGVLCFELEAAGLIQDFPCLAIRGICDYSDSHKNKAWQGYAAAAAAAFAKELLSAISPERVLQDKAIPQLVSDPVAQELLAATNETISKHATKQDTRYENDKQIECHRCFKTSQYEDFKNINPDRVPGTCKWVLEHPQYKKWRQSSHDNLLWISADPGCGKSVLAKALIDEELDNTGDHTVCYFFFKDNEAQDGLATALCALLHQLFGRLPHLLRHAANAFEKNDHKLQNEVDELWRIFLAAATDDSTGAVICIFDALDECQRDGRRKLVRLVTDFYARRVSASTRTFPLKFLATSRPYQDIESGFSNVPPALPSIRLAGEESNADISEEINLVIRQKIQELRTDQEVRDMLQAKLLAISNRTYLWLHLVWDELQRSRRSKTALMKKIDSLPSTVEQAYESILGRLRPEQREDARILLHIIVGARRPLTLIEMDVAFQLAVDSPGATAHEELELNTDRVKSDIRELCGLFVFISDNRIYLIHHTAKEFLVAKKGVKESTGKFWRHSLRGEFSSQIMTQICVQYLSFRDIGDNHRYKMRKADSDARDFPLLEYSAENWPAHFRDTDDADEGLLSLIFKLYDAKTARFETWLSIFWNAAYPYRGRYDLKPLHLAALNGHTQVVELLLKEGADVNAEGGGYSNALQAASSEGHAEIVRLLLEKGADVNAEGGVFGSVLRAASSEGHVDIAKLLLEKGADVNAESGISGNALRAASARGYTEIVRLLLEKGADVNAEGGALGNALWAASARGYTDIAKLLLEKGADVSAEGGEYGNALQAASARGYTEIRKGADVNAEGGVFGNALWAASTRCYTDIAKLLLEKGADVNGNALRAALYGGHAEIVKLLLEKGADVCLKDDTFAQTSLSWAAENGHEAVVKLLLAVDDTDVDTLDHSGRMPLSWAAANGHDAVVKLLLDSSRVNIESVDVSGRTALTWATTKGHEGVVKMLLDAYAATASSIVQQTLFSAVAKGHEAVVEMLIERNGVDLAAEDGCGLTALQLAVFKGHQAVEKLLLAHDAVVVSDFYRFRFLFGENKH